jgi:transcription initiation factor IIE alpha subunit
LFNQIENDYINKLIFEQAKEMHKKEIIDAYMDRMDVTDKEAIAKIIGEQYYQETYGKAKQ